MVGDRMQDIIRNFCREFDYPSEAAETFAAAWQTIEACAPARGLLEENQRLLWQDAFTELGSELVRLDAAAARAGLHPYTVYQLFFILCSPQMKSLYAQAGLSPAICRDSLADLKWKMLETHRIWGVWGVCWGAWYRPFFLLRRFCLGRLEFERVPGAAAYRDGGLSLGPGDPVVNVHIPEAGPLRHELALNSYRQAYGFYRGAFPPGPIPFQCESWMLDPRISALFPAGNLRAFCADYHLTAAESDSEDDDRWRIFHVPDTVPVSSYPEDTALQRVMKRWLLDGNRMGIGVGVFFFDGERIL